MNSKERRQAERRREMAGRIACQCDVALNTAHDSMRFRAYDCKTTPDYELGWQQWSAKRDAEAAKRNRMATYARKHQTSKKGSRS